MCLNFTFSEHCTIREAGQSKNSCRKAAKKGGKKRGFAAQKSIHLRRGAGLRFLAVFGGVLFAVLCRLGGCLLGAGAVWRVSQSADLADSREWVLTCIFSFSLAAKPQIPPPFFARKAGIFFFCVWGLFVGGVRTSDRRRDRSAVGRNGKRGRT